MQTDIRRLWVEQDPGFFTVGAIADIQFQLRVLGRGVKVKELEVRAKGQNRSAIGGIAGTKGLALKRAMEECMKQAIPQIISAMRQE